MDSLQIKGGSGSLRKKEECAFEGSVCVGGGGRGDTNARYEFGNNFNCVSNLLMSMSSLLISKKRTILQLIGY